MTIWQALELATKAGAWCLGREGKIGSLKPVYANLWRIDDLGHGGVEDPIRARIPRPARRVELLLVKGRTVVEVGEFSTADEYEIST